MKKINSLGLIVILALSGCTTLRGLRGFDYRGARWGMTQKEVEALRPGFEHGEGDSASKYLFESLDVAGYKAAAGYQFGEGGLNMVSILFEEIGAPQYPQPFMKVKELLSEKYGAPRIDGEQVVAVRRYMNTRNPGAYPPFAGITSSSWRIGKTQIELSCGGNCSGGKGEAIVVQYQDMSGAGKGL